MKKALIVLLCFGSSFSIKAQIAALPYVKIDKNTNDSKLIQKYYRLAIQYKDGKGVPMDYAKAFYYFSKAADLGDAQSVYALGYMHYKGLGTVQDYPLAARLFQKGAFAGRDNSMYFYALCWRNGYGLQQNEDSARYWLRKDSALGYRQAIQELKMKVPENSKDSAFQMLQTIRNAALPKHTIVNEFIPITTTLPDSIVIAGTYKGYIVQYDWSGSHVISSKKLNLEIKIDSTDARTRLLGQWEEEGTAPIMLNAHLLQQKILFDSTEYSIKDHYSLSHSIRYDFKQASLSFVRKADSVFLAGNIQLFSPQRKEPSKPLLIVMSRTTKNEKSNTNIKDLEAMGKKDSANHNSTAKIQLFSAYPSPFASLLNVKFSIDKKSEIVLRLFDIAGALVYSKKKSSLSAGKYLIRLEPGNIAPGTYLLQLSTMGDVKTIKVIHK